MKVVVKRCSVYWSRTSLTWVVDERGAFGGREDARPVNRRAWHDWALAVADAVARVIVLEVPDDKSPAV